MPEERMCAHALDRQLTTLTLVCFVALFASCSTGEKETQLPPVLRAERQLARAEKVRSDPPQKVAEILSAARTVVGEISKSSGDANEPPVKVYNHAMADLGDELPELTKYRGSFESLTVQDYHTGEIYRLRLGPVERGEYSSAYFQRLLDAGRLRVRRGEEAVVIPALLKDPEIRRRYQFWAFSHPTGNPISFSGSAAAEAYIDLAPKVTLSTQRGRSPAVKADSQLSITTGGPRR